MARGDRSEVSPKTIGMGVAIVVSRRLCRAMAMDMALAMGSRLMHSRSMRVANAFTATSTAGSLYGAGHAVLAIKQRAHGLTYAICGSSFSALVSGNRLIGY